MSRGPYKQHEYDPGVRVPRTTFFNRRKRQCVDSSIQSEQPVDSVNQTIPSDDEWAGDETPQANTNDKQTDGFDFNNHQIPSDDEWDGEVEGSGDEASSAGTNKRTDGFNFNNDQDEKVPLYPGASVTKTQSLLLILCFVIRHKLTDVALGDLLLLLNTMFPNTVPPTKHKFYKLFKLENSEKHFYCSSCMSYLGNDTTIAACNLCDQLFDEKESIKNGHYFIYIPVQQQIVSMLSNNKLFPYLNNRNLDLILKSRTVKDVTTSELYKELIVKHGLNANDVSLTWNTDGIPIFNSSNFSVWPLQAFVNELPQHLRGKNILLLGLWFGQKPVMNVFLKPFVEECRKLELDGFLFGSEIRPRKVFALLLSADSPARALVRNVKQYNGMNGCDWCEFEGVTVPNNNGPPVRYYPRRTPVVMRTAKKQAEYAIEATLTNPVRGVKGMTCADLLPSFDTVRGTVTDFMHSVCLGVVRQMVDLWCNSKYHCQGYYIGQRVNLIDQRLQLISPPSEIHRSPRSLSHRCYWKASEWRAFIFYSLVILQGVLPSRYLNHFFLFVFGIYSLSGDSISENDISLSEFCLTKFVIQLEELYGLSSCKFNVHCLTHLGHCVRDCGPLWATSTFTFEGHNHVLVNLFHGTQSVPQQITDMFLLKNKVLTMARNCIDDYSDASVNDVLVKLMYDVRYKHKNNGDGLSVLGSCKVVKLDAHRLVALQDLLGVIVNIDAGHLYDRFVYNHQFYSGVNYTRSKRHTNHNISFKHSVYKYGVILGLLNVKPSCCCSLEVSQYCQCSLYSIVIVKPMEATRRSLFRDVDFNISCKFIVEVEETNNVIALYPSQIERKCICLTLDDKRYFCPLPYRIYDD